MVTLIPKIPIKTSRRLSGNRMGKSARTLFSIVSLIIAILLTAAAGQAATISDRSGGAIYWGGKYVNIKPSAYRDVIGRRTAVDQMEVIMDNDLLTVKITGPYFFNYVHNIKRTREAPPGDLYISSKGWQVSGTAPYVNDIFDASEGWDHVVSLENKKVYTLKFSSITMTSVLPYSNKYRAHQAWRGGYGEDLDDAQVILTDSGLTFIFSVRNLRLESEIGLHWTMKCGNDIIEGSALIPALAMAPVEPAFAAPLSADPVDAVASDVRALESATPYGAASPGAGTPPLSAGGGGPSLIGPALAAAVIPGIHFSSHGHDGSAPAGPVFPTEPGSPQPFDQPPPAPGPYTPVPEPSSALLLLAGLAGILVKPVLGLIKHRDKT